MKGFLCKIFNRRLSLTSRTVLSVALLSLLGSFGLFTSSASAISFQLENAQKIEWDASKAFVVNNTETKTKPLGISKEVAYYQWTSDSDNFKPKYFKLAVKNQLKKGQIVVLNYTFLIPTSGIKNFYFSEGKYEGIACDSKCFVLDQVTNSSHLSGYFIANENINMSSEISGTVWLQILDPSPSDAITLIVENLDDFYVRGGMIADIVSVNTAIDNVNNSVLEGNKQAHDDSQKQLDAINNQTQQDKDQYDQEKQEEADRENSAKDDGNSLLGIFNISLLNPFAGIWEIFNAGGCTAIPTIASWIHSDNATYCSWWPQSIRATLTPVFSLASMMLLFGFVARWLGGNEGIGIDGVDF